MIQCEFFRRAKPQLFFLSYFFCFFVSVLFFLVQLPPKQWPKLPAVAARPRAVRVEVRAKTKKFKVTATMTSTGPTKIQRVTVHPLVLLSTVDHYNRVAKDTRKRVVGVLLGDVYKGTVDVLSSFAGFLTFPSCFLTHCDQFPLRKMRETKASGIWITFFWRTWCQCSEK